MTGEHNTGPVKRGESAWKANRDRIAARNDEVRKAGIKERQAGERRMAEQRRAADLKERASLQGR